MHKYCSFIFAIGLIASPSAWAGSLAAGKPANVRQAQMSTGSLVVAGGLGAITIAVIAVAASGGGDNSTSNQPTTTTTSSTATTS
jgi:hypothetical protein